VPQGQEYKESPLASQGVGPAFVTIEQAALRTIGTNWCMPEYMISGDASNANYASTMVSESPFVKYCQAEQAKYAASNRRIFWKVLWFAWQAGRLGAIDWAELRKRVEIQIEPPDVATRNVDQETARNKTLYESGILSDETWAGREGLDYLQEKQNGATPQQVSGMGSPFAARIEQESGKLPPEEKRSGMSALPTTPQEAPAGVSVPVVGSQPAEVMPENVTTTASLNGAQITAIKDVLADVVLGKTVPSVGEELLVAVGIDRERAKKMVADSAAVATTRAVIPAAESSGRRLQEAAELLWRGYP